MPIYMKQCIEITNLLGEYSFPSTQKTKHTITYSQFP